MNPVPSRSALIGHTGFVGSNLDRQAEFADKYNSKNIEDMRGCEYELVVCAGVQAVKWWANRNPEEDRAGIARLADVLATVRAERMVLISTVDVYPSPVEVDERTELHGVANHAYGTHRLGFEDFVRGRFERTHVIRLPGLFGEGLKKNVIYDLLNDNQLEKVDPNGSYQYYCLDDLSRDIGIAVERGLDLVNFATEPLVTREIRDRLFAGKALGEPAAVSGKYDFRTVHADLWGGQGGYMRGREAIFGRLEKYIHSYRRA